MDHFPFLKIHYLIKLITMNGTIANPILGKLGTLKAVIMDIQVMESFALCLQGAKIHSNPSNWELANFYKSGNWKTPTKVSSLISSEGPEFCHLCENQKGRGNPVDVSFWKTQRFVECVHASCMSKTRKNYNYLHVTFCSFWTVCSPIHVKLCLH